MHHGERKSMKKKNEKCLNLPPSELFSFDEIVAGVTGEEMELESNDSFIDDDVDGVGVSIASLGKLSLGEAIPVSSLEISSVANCKFSSYGTVWPFAKNS